MENLLREYRLALLGARGAGKSTFAYRFVSGIFTEDYDNYVYEKYGFRKQITLIENENPLIDIMDALEGEKSENSEIMAKYAMTSHSTGGFIIAYSVTSLETFTAVSKYIEDIYKAQESEDVPILIVGTKTDLPDRVVSHTEGEELAKKYGALFYEVNLPTGANVMESVIQLCLTIRDRRLNGELSTIRKVKTKERERCTIC